jgi:hypothetical protein
MVLCESRLIYGVWLCDLDDGWQGINKSQLTICYCVRKVMVNEISSKLRVPELEFENDVRRRYYASQ